jgi:glycosyltransferase involved in cell wall biosynthesis
MTNKKGNKKHYPFVSVCTPTFNRRPFIQTMFECFKNQTYPKNRMEWIIVDDGTDKIQDLVAAVSSEIPQIKYFPLPKKITLGAKRNFMHEKTKGSIIVYMDDDDYYPPDRVEHAVERLQSSSTALCAGSSELYVYFKHIQKMYQCGPYSPTHATAGTFAFKSELLKITKYNENASLAEEREFLKEYTIPFIQLDPLKSILVFSHEHNTFDKRKMLDNPHPDYMKESKKTVDMFIKHKKEDAIKKFFLEDIDKLLENYQPGRPEMKPDVLKQMKEIEAERKKMMEQHQQQQGNGRIFVQQPNGQQPIELSIQDTVNIINQQQQQIQALTERNSQLETIVVQLQSQIYNKSQTSETTTIPDSGQLKQIKELIARNIETEKKLKTQYDIEKTLRSEIENLKNTQSTGDNKPIVIIKSKSEPEVHIDMTHKINYIR